MLAIVSAPAAASRRRGPARAPEAVGAACLGSAGPIVHASELPGLGDRIDALEASGEAESMLENVRQTRQVWTYAFRLDYMMTTLGQGARET